MNLTVQVGRSARGVLERSTAEVIHHVAFLAAVQDKIAALLRMADDAATSMNNELRVQLVKIPKQVPDWQSKSLLAHTFCA